MQGFVSLRSKSGTKKIILSQKDCYLAIVDDSIIECEEIPRHADNVIRVRWIEMQNSWLISKHGINEKRHAFIDELLFEINGIEVFFEKKTNSPLLAGGSEFDCLKLDYKLSYIIGRDNADIKPEASIAALGDTPNDESVFIYLDSQCVGIDAKHVQLQYREGDWFISDISQRGTTLNGIAFRDEKLIYGDRFAIDNYLFEFRTNEIRRVDHLNLGHISAENLSVDVLDYKSKKPKRILNEVSLSIQTGEFIGILGGSGQGKSTLMNALCGMRKADDGSVLVGGIPVERLSNDFPGVIGYVPQDDIVHRELTVLQALEYSARLKLKLRKKERADLIEKTIERLGLAEHKDKKIAILSGGQRKRLSIAIEMLSKPSVLFLDEPSSGLDPSTEASLMELLQSLTKNKLTVICTTHVLQKAYLFDRLLFIHDGRLVFDGKAQEAREYFLDSVTGITADTKQGFAPTPLEKVYDIILSHEFNAKEWEMKFHSGRKKNNITSSHAADDQKLRNLSSNQVNSLSKLWTLLARQHAILLSDWLNLMFLMMQVILIGLIIAWVSSDFSFRLFLGMIACIWFGCSNGAQQIVAEFAVFKREKVCGLGLNPYAVSKCFYVGGVSMIQSLLLFFLVTVVGHFFHPYSYEKETFQLGIKKRMEEFVKQATPLAANEVPLSEEDGFIDIVDETTPAEELDKSYASVDPTSTDGGGAIAAKSANVEDFTWLGLNWQNLLAFGNMFHFSNNITDSSSMALLDQDGNQVLDSSGMPTMSPSIPIARIVTMTVLLKLAAFALAALTGVGLGLAISALVRNPTQAVMWVPLLLIPQILLGGYVITVPEMSAAVRRIAEIVPSFCCQRIIDNSNLYSRKMPDLSNTTKTPIFLTTNGEKEVVQWHNGLDQFEEKFDKESDVNVSWQNLLISPERLGQHKIAKEKVGPTRSVDMQIVAERDDVNGSPRSLFDDLRYSQLAVIRLLICLVLSYFVILGTLKWKTK